LTGLRLNTRSDRRKTANLRTQEVKLLFGIKLLRFKLLTGRIKLRLLLLLLAESGAFKSRNICGSHGLPALRDFRQLRACT
jgi:hypothetical protein